MLARVRERELDEFASIFQRSVISTIEVSGIELSEVVLLVDFSDRGESCGAVAAELKRRFGAHVSARFLLHPGDAAHEPKAKRVLGDLPADERRIVPGDPVASLHGILEREKPSLIVAPAPLRLHDPGEEAEALGTFIDTLLVATPIPTLLVRAPLEGPVFDRILANIPGGRHDLIEQFSFAFKLCAAGGTIRLLHVLEEEWADRLAEVLEVTPEIDTAEGRAGLLSAIQTRMNHLLRSAVRTARHEDFHVESSMRIGDPFEIVPEEAARFSLVILGSAESHREFLQSRAYELIRRVPGMPVLTL